MKPERLRPFERVVLRLTDEGLTSSEIGWRFRRSPGHIERVIDLTRHPRSPADTAAEHVVLDRARNLVLTADYSDSTALWQVAPTPLEIDRADAAPVTSRINPRVVSSVRLRWTAARLAPVAASPLCAVTIG